MPGTDLTLEKGQIVVLPVYGFHYDEEYFPNPTKFNPEHFTAEAKAKRHPYAYMPFGHGPRNCIGTQKTVTIEPFSRIEVFFPITCPCRSFQHEDSRFSKARLRSRSWFTISSWSPVPRRKFRPKRRWEPLWSPPKDSGWLSDLDSTNDLCRKRVRCKRNNVSDNLTK